MKKLAIVGCLSLCLVIGLAWCPPAASANSLRFYLGGEVLYSMASLKSGGHNTAGDFANTGTGTDKAVKFGGHLGLDFSGFLRADFGFHYRGDLQFITKSYQLGPFYDYTTDVDAYVLMFSLYLSPFMDYTISPYVGGGVGAAITKMATDDTIVSGKVDKTNMAWQLEAGLQFYITNNFAFQVGYRYLSLGKYDLDLSEGGFPSGNFTGDIWAHEIIAAIRIIF